MHQGIRELRSHSCGANESNLEKSADPFMSSGVPEYSSGGFTQVLIIKLNSFNFIVLSTEGRLCGKRANCAQNVPGVGWVKVW